MELLQNFLTMLTTPNEGLVGIIFNAWGIPFSFIEIIVSALLFTQILNIKYTRKQLVCYLLILAFTSVISNAIFGKPYSSYINIIVGIALIMYIFKSSFLKSILAVFIPTIIIVILETIFIKVFIMIFNTGFEELSYIPLIRVTIAMLVYLSVYLIYRITKHFKISINLIENMSKKNKSIFILNTGFAIFAIGIQFYIIGYYLDKLPLFITLMSIISLVVYFSISIFSLIKTTKLEETTQSLEEAKIYNKTLKLLHDNLRIFKHDFSNIMQSIEGYITNNDMKGLKIYYKDIKHECDNSNNLTALSPTLINDPALYSLIASKYYLAEQFGISFNVNISVNFNELDTTPYILTRILGILLDNAIDAAKDSSEKEISFEVIGPFKNKDFKKYIISIENSYSNKDVNLDRIREKGYTSKTTDESSHGLGLWEVNKILKKSKNLNLHTTKNDKFFKQELEIFDLKHNN